jgi:hypothetical protein
VNFLKQDNWDNANWLLKDVNHFSYGAVTDKRWEGELLKNNVLTLQFVDHNVINGNNLIKAVNTYAVPLLTYSFGVIKWSKTNLQNINVQTLYKILETSPQICY